MEEAVPVLAVPRQQTAPEQGFHPKEPENRCPQDEFSSKTAGNPQDVPGNISPVKQEDGQRSPQVQQAEFFLPGSPCQPSVGQQQLDQVTAQNQEVPGTVGIYIPVMARTGEDPENLLVPVVGENQPSQQKVQDQKTLEPTGKHPVFRSPVAGKADPDHQEDQQSHTRIKAVPQQTMESIPARDQGQAQEPDGQPGQPYPDAPSHSFPGPQLEDPPPEGASPQDHPGHGGQIQSWQRDDGPELFQGLKDTCQSLHQSFHGPHLLCQDM